ncbi:MAG TPA: AAA domain-containing protein, partial [Xylella sp.]
PLNLSDPDSRISIADCESSADRSIRFKIFLLTTHYWEGRWLLEMQALLPHLDEEKKKKGRSSVEKRWRRRMKLTPCIVSTFFTLPEKMEFVRHDGKGFGSHYLYNFADLLIVDEAGQVLPEVAGASFALSKKALVIGDHMQIEPIWSVPASIDIGNLVSAKLLPETGNQEAYQRLCRTGKSAASGSVMQIAQTLSRYHYDPALARGMFLYEHHRCFDEIVSYCNTLCYQGKLIPTRGPKATAASKGDEWPALGYLHIDGMCENSSGGSRRNPHEADTIAAWLKKHRDSLEADYGEPLHRIVGIVTPFSAQVHAISEACHQAGIPEGITVGTVHSLQGAQRPVVIFSPVYSKHTDGRFIDQRPSMLNVAVSRAKNTFLVFGDMDVFVSASKTTPRGLLADYLFRDPDNALSFEHLPRKDLQALSTVHVLQDTQAHDVFLLETLKNVQRDIHIVTPWMIQRCIEDIGAFKAMQDAVERHVQVTVYTDLYLNTDAGKSKNKRDQVFVTADTLRKVGIQVNFVDRVHSKMVIADDDVFCVGSFNWFSASRYREDYVRHETSLVYRGYGLAGEREAKLKSLKTINDPRIPKDA